MGHVRRRGTMLQEKVHFNDIASSTFLKLFWSATLLCGFALIHRKIGELALTGDEPRYLYAGVRPWLPGNSTMPLEFEKWLSAHNLGGLGIPPVKGMHSVIHSWVMSPILYFFGLSAARWFCACLVFLSTVFFVFKYQSQFTWSKALTASIFLFSVPVLPYSRTLYPDIWGMILISAILVVHSRKITKPLEIPIAIFCAILLPFIHIRFLPPALILLGAMLWRWWKEKCKNYKKAALLQLILTVLLIRFFYYYQHLISGRATSAIPAVEPSLSALIDRTAIHLFSYRHGILIFNPFILLGVAGLLLGIFHLDRKILTAAAVFIATFFSFIWGSGLESFPGRFWVAAIPTMMIGSSYWWKSVSLSKNLLIGGPLIFLTGFNSITFANRWGEFLANRFGLATFDKNFHQLGDRFHLGLITVTDPFDRGNIPLIEPSNGRNVLVVVILIVVFLALLARKNYLSSIFSSVGLVVIFAFIGRMAFVTPIPNSEFTKVEGIDKDGQIFIQLTFNSEQDINAYKIGDFLEAPLWGYDTKYPSQFVLQGELGNGKKFAEQIIPAFQMGRLNLPDNLVSLKITSLGANVDKSWLDFDLQLFR